MLSTDVIAHIAKFYICDPEDRMMFLTLSKEVYSEVRLLPILFPIKYVPRTFVDFGADEIDLIVPPRTKLREDDLNIVANSLTQLSLPYGYKYSFVNKIPNIRTLVFPIDTKQKVRLSGELMPSLSRVAIADHHVVTQTPRPRIMKRDDSIVWYLLRMEKFGGDMTINHAYFIDGEVACINLFVNRIRISTRLYNITALLDDSGLFRNNMYLDIRGPSEFNLCHITVPLNIYEGALVHLRLVYIEFEVPMEFPTSLGALTLDTVTGNDDMVDYIDESFVDLRSLTTIYSDIIKYIHLSVCARMVSLTVHELYEESIEPKEGYYNMCDRVTEDVFPELIEYSAYLLVEIPKLPNLVILSLHNCDGPIPSMYGGLRQLSLYCCLLDTCIPQELNKLTSLTVVDCPNIIGPLPCLDNIVLLHLRDLDMTAEVNIAYNWRHGISINVTNCPQISGTIDMVGHKKKKYTRPKLHNCQIKLLT
jgi:hypothetical protein